MGRTGGPDWFDQLDDDALIELTLGASDDRYWELIAELHRRGTPAILRRALELAEGNDAEDRGTGADILRQLGLDDGYPYIDQSLPTLIRLCADPEPFVVDSALRAIAALGDVRGLEVVIAAAGHEDANVREAVASAATSLVGDTPVPSDHPAVHTLLGLMTDSAAKVRGWSTFGLGTITGADGPEIRQAMLERLDDPDHETRCEAMVGLARRRDRRVLPHIASALADDTVYRLVLESAAYMRSPELLPSLAQLDFDDESFAELLEVARRRCDPAHLADEVALVRRLIDAAGDHFPPLNVALSCEVLPIGDGEIEITVGLGETQPRYQLDALLRRAGNSVEAMVELIAPTDAR